MPGFFMGWFDTFKRRVVDEPLPSGLHWVRIFYGQHAAGSGTTEVMLDNKPWETMQAVMAALPWPAKDGYYSTRLFLIIEDASPPCDP